MLFFIMPHKLKVDSGIKNFQYDVTMLNWTDSVTVNFTFDSPSMYKPQNFEIKCGDQSFVCKSFYPLYTDIKKGGYEIRITSKFSIDEIKAIFESRLPPKFCFSQDGIAKWATYKSKAWEKDRKKLNDIMQLFIISQ